MGLLMCGGHRIPKDLYAEGLQLKCEEELPLKGSFHTAIAAESRTMNSTSSLNVTPSLAPAVCICDYAMNSYIYFNNLAAAAVCFLLAVLTALSNVAVMVTIIRTASLHSPANILLCSLSFGDFLVAVFPYPVLAAFLVSSNARGTDCCLYKKLFTMHKFSLGIVFGCMVQVSVMCWDRYKATSEPFRYRVAVSKKKMMAMTVASWVTWLIDFVISNTVLTPKVMSIKGSVEIVAFVCICVVSQILTLRAIRAHNIAVGDVILRTTALAREKKMAVTLRWIIGASFVSGVPFLVYIVSELILGKDSLFCSLLSPWATIALFLNSAVDPVTYFWRHKNMRTAALELVRS